MRLEGQPYPVLSLLDQFFWRQWNRVFSTALLIYPGGDGERIFTSDPETFSLGGRKWLLGREWSEHVITQGLAFVSRSKDEIRRWTLNSDWVDQLSCNCLLNMPIVSDGAVVGTFNIGTTDDRFVGSELDDLSTLLTLIGPSFVAARLKSDAQAAGAGSIQIETTEA